MVKVLCGTTDANKEPLFLRVYVRRSTYNINLKQSLIQCYLTQFLSENFIKINPTMI